MADYLMRFFDRNNTFYLILRNQKGMKDIVWSLAELFDKNSGTAGQAAATFLYYAAGPANCELLSKGFFAGLTILGVDVVNERISVYPSRGSRTCFSGDVASFAAWVDAQEESLSGKTVVFRYTGGSGVGNRVVKVEKVEDKKGRSYLCGMDMHKGKHRRYDRSRIEGDILILAENGEVSVEKPRRKTSGASRRLNAGC